MDEQQPKKIPGVDLFVIEGNPNAEGRSLKEFMEGVDNFVREIVKLAQEKKIGPGTLQTAALLLAASMVGSDTNADAYTVENTVEMFRKAVALTQQKVAEVNGTPAPLPPIFTPPAEA